MIDNATALVSDTDGLRDALSSDNGIDHIFFGANITLAYGITIYPGKAALVIDGTYEGVTYTFTDMESTDNGNTIGVRSASAIQLTLQNINITGRNFFGVPYISETVNTNDVVVEYINVVYTGKQMIFHQRGTTRFIGCNIMIDGQPSSQVEEVGQICKVEIGGQTTIVKTNNEDAIFWFFGSSTRRPYLKILTGANVTITTAHYFMYEHYAPDYIIESGASFTLNTNSGISWDTSHSAASFFVGENASFRYTQAMNRGFATLYIDGELTVNEGANFYMQADFTNNHPLIRFTGSSSRLNLNSPRSFALYNGSGTPAAVFSFGALTPFIFAGNQVNIWDSPAELSIAGTFDDRPRYKWNKPNYAPFRIEGRAGSSRTYIDLHNFTEEELEQMSSLDDLNPYLSSVFSEGYLPLSINPIVIGIRPITGKTARRAKVRVLYVAIDPYPDCEADDDGFFSVTPTDPIPFAEVFTITANTPFLLTTLTAVSQDEGELTILEAPISISFIAPPIAGFTDIVLRRNIANARVVVSDKRADRTEWVIWAKIEGPLRTEENDILNDAVVFANEIGELITLNGEYTAIHTDGPYLDIDDVEITWDENRGILARITVPIRSRRRYTTQLDWVVYPQGVQPEGSD